MSLFRDDGIAPRTRRPGEADRIMPPSPGRTTGGGPPYARHGGRGGER
ncbi:hypothetical protein RKE30_33905 [Streptomyces sp. Li-HN-5-11]|nr:hypothetical protein [Streptomyces sp. Li-HN-5-11]WNM35014.1 hypothetical protein RKE30_33905 [Streptomyces sp. Li-HN-5-11]